jgi:hypothetical protein
LGGQAIPGKIAFCKTEVMNGIQQICFAYAIAATNAHNRFGKNKLLLKVIFELKNLYGTNKKTQEIWLDLCCVSGSRLQFLFE